MAKSTKQAPEKGEQKIELSPEKAAEVMAPAAGAIQRRWLSAAVSVANAIKNGQPVSNGTFEDLHRLREQFEELERARIMLTNLGAAAKKKDG